MIDSFIALLLVWIWFWDLPAGVPSRRLLAALSQPFVWLGLWHNWAMFAPDPLRVNRRLKAIIHYTDGTADEWRPIEPLRSSRFLDMLWFRHFKYQFSVLSGTHRILWKPLCDWLLRQAKDDGRCVASVQLVREYQLVQPPTSVQPLGEWKAAVFHEQAAVLSRCDR